MKYWVEVTKTVIKQYEIEADSPEEAAEHYQKGVCFDSDVIEEEVTDVVEVDDC